MAKRLVAVTRGFAYPVGDYLARVREAGGLSRLTADQARVMRFKVVPVGGDCSDMPADAAARYLSRGDIAVVSDEGVADGEIRVE